MQELHGDVHDREYDDDDRGCDRDHEMSDRGCGRDHEMSDRGGYDLLDLSTLVLALALTLVVVLNVFII